MDRRTFVLGGGAVLAAGSPLGRFALAADLRATDRRVAELRRLVHGTVLAAGDHDFALAHRLYNPVFDRIAPLAVLRAASAHDVAVGVRWAVRHGIRVVARSGGHSYLGQSTVAGGLVIDLGRLRGVALDPTARVATVAAGAQLIDVYDALAARGFTIPAGSCPSVGIAGVALGGGIGLAGRAFGLTSDGLLSADVVLADGSLVTASAHAHADLRWALRGGGGGTFGIVTRFRFRAHRVGDAAVAYARVALDDGEELLRRWQAHAPHAEHALTLDLTLTAGGAILVGQHLTSEARLGALVDALCAGLDVQARSVHTVPYRRVAMIWAGCSGHTLAQCHTVGTAPGGVLGRESFAAKSDYVDRPLPAAARAALVAAVRGGGGSAILDAYGGAINALPADATAFPHRSSLFSIQLYAGYASGHAAAAHAWLRNTQAALRPYVSGAAYANYQDGDLATWPTAYFGANLPRLQTVKRRYDPDDVFRGRQTVRP